MISIITPVLNGAKYIEQNIRSIRALSIPFEHIIVDGGSTDGTLEILSKFPHLIVINQKEKNGMYGAISQGFDTSSGDLLSYVNCDDEVIKVGFEKMYEVAVSTKAAVVYTDAIEYFINEDKRIKIPGCRFPKYFLKQGYMPFVQPSSVYTRDVYQQVGGFRHDIFRISGDLDFFQRIAKLDDAKFAYVPVISTVFLKHGQSLGDMNNDLHQKEMKIIGKGVGMINSMLFKISRM